MNFFVASIKKHGLPILVFLGVACAYFYPQLNGKALSQPDTNHSYRGTKESWDYYAETGERNLWTNSQFSGMPTIQVGGLENKNIYQYLGKVSTLFIKRPIGTFLFGAIAMYILLMVLGVSTWLSTIGALTFAYSTQYIILYSVGHNSKLDVLMTMPIVVAGAYTLFKKNYVNGFALLTLGLGLTIYRNHYQMAWYIGLFLVAYYFIQGIRLMNQKEQKPLVRTILYSLLAIFLALGPSLTRIITTLDYTPESIRGKTIVKDVNVEEGASSGTGLTWEFATNFSYSLVDLASMIVPRFAGGGGKERIDNQGALAREIYEANYRNRTAKVASYYGNQPFTEGPSYIGIGIFLLFIVGLGMVSSTWRWWSLFCVIFAVLYAMGSTLGGFHKFLFETIPLFDKFRAPSSFLSVIVLFFPLVGMMGLHKFIKEEDKSRFLRWTYIAGGTLAGFCLVMYAIGPGLIDMTHEADQRMINAGISRDVLQDQRVDFFRADLLRSAAIVLLIMGAIWLYAKDKINSKILILAVGLVSILDIMGVDYRYIYPDRFSKKSSQVGKFEPNPADREILKDKDPHFRVFDLSQDPFRTSDVSYFHKSLGGYNAAKLRRYNDIIEYYLKNGNGNVASMLNAKYYIKRDDQGQKIADRNEFAMGNAWFVDQLQFVRTDQEEIDKLGSINPRSTAIVHNDFAGELGGITPSSNGSIQLTKYSPDELIYQYNTPQNNLAVFSEVWYGPDKGWQAYIDGEPAEHIRVNYILRAMRVPAGSHTIKFVFDPLSYRLGEILSLIFSIITLLGMMYYIYYRYKNAPAELQTVPKKKRKVKVKKKRKKK